MSTALHFSFWNHFFGSVSDSKAVTKMMCCLFSVSHYLVIHILLLFSKNDMKLESRKQFIQHCWSSAQPRLFFYLVSWSQYLAMAGLEQITMEIEILDWEQTRKFHQFSSNSFHSFRLYHLAKRWKERCQGCEPCPGEECLLSLVDFLSQWVFFGYKIMMLRVVWCLIEI